MSVANIRRKGGITGDCHPIFKELRARMIAGNIGWKKLAEACGVSHVTLTESFGGRTNMTFPNLERTANSLGYHLVLVPMTEGDIEYLAKGEYVSPGVIYAEP